MVARLAVLELRDDLDVRLRVGHLRLSQLGEVPHLRIFILMYFRIRQMSTKTYVSLSLGSGGGGGL